MDTKLVYTKQNPKESANPISKLFFGWTGNMFWKGATRDLIMSDLYRPLQIDESKKVSDRLEESWNNELYKWNQRQLKVREETESSGTDNVHLLVKALIRTFWKEYIFIGILLCIQYTVLVVVYPVIVSWIISYFTVEADTKRITKTDALTYAGILIVCLVLIVFVMHHCNLRSQQIGMRVRVACSSLIYKKILRLSKTAFTQISPGQVVNLLSNDVSRFDELCYFLHFTWITPIQVICVTAIIWHKAGVSGMIGIAALFVMTLPPHSVCIRLGRQLRQMVAMLTDKRVQFMNELITGIEVIKMYAWEQPFARIVRKIRSAEVKNIKLAAYLRGVYLSLVVFTNRAVLFFTLLAFILIDKYPKAEITFMLSSYYEVLQLTTTLFFPQALLLIGETTISIRRLQQFLLLEEFENHENGTSVKSQQNGVVKFKKSSAKKVNVESIKIVEGNQISNLNNVESHRTVSINLERVSANWTPAQLPPTLCSISMKVQGGELCTLVGPVGSGKTSILQIILRELPLGAGHITLHCKPLEHTGYNKQGYVADTPNLRISYASQEAWLFNGSVRDNILFGQPYDKDRYKAVTKVCALIQDFQQFPYGDMSNVGESGSSLSGGQKARINLARAVYRQADVYLLDDPLSAVDTRVAKYLFQRCIKQYLNGKTRILVTHQLQFLKQADSIAVLDRGSLKMQGTYNELTETNKDFVDMIQSIKTSTETQRQNSVAETPAHIVEKRSEIKSFSGRPSVTSNVSSVVSYDYEDQGTAPEHEEVAGTGRVSYGVYKIYFRHGSSWFILGLMIFVFIISQVATSGNDYWVSYMTNVESIRRSLENGTQPSNHSYSYYVLNGTVLADVFSLDNYGLITTKSAFYLYLFCILSCIVTILVRNIFFITVCTNAGKNLHNSMFVNILHAVMNFFHQNPSGRILNRFSKDVGAVDEMLPKIMLETLQIFSVILGVLCMVVAVNYWMIFPLILLLTVFFIGRLIYLRTAQSIKRLEGITKSPIFSHVNSTLSGLVTIRSAGADVLILLRKQFDDLQDVHTGAWYMTISAPAAFGLYLDIFTTIFIACLCFSFILKDADSVLGGNVGLAIAQCLIIIGTLQHGVKQSGEVASHITSVERILQYTDLPKESSWTSNDPPPPNWPEHGRLTLTNVSMSYDRNEPPVLKNLNVTVEPGWKVGIVGRTGAGKSSLISALFRLFTDGLSGEIKIDGRDTGTLGLHELRSRISIIPQQPFLLSETLRYNLDPFATYNDELLWNSLRQVELNDLVLDQKVMHSGSNMSMGQKQLICLARAILRDNKILILDEATANIDSYTDELIQRTIRTNFVDCTVLTIAHRLNTIIDCDRIIVMDAGRIAEFGPPHELLRDKPNGIFSQMVNNTGVVMAQTLRNQAEEVYLKRITPRSVEANLNSNNTIERDKSNIIEQSSL